MAVQSSSEVDASDVVPCPRQQGLEVLIKTTKTNQDRGLRLVCELCAKAKRGAQEHFASEEEQAAATEEATMEKAWIDRPREYATVGRLATHVWAAHGVGNSIVDALQPELKADLLSQHLPKTVVDDGGLLICVKPAGISTRDFGHTDGMVLLSLPSSGDGENLTTPQPAHRLDTATAGCLVMGRTKSATSALGLAFERRRCKKQYCAIVCGAFPSDELGKSGVIDKPLGGKSCVTHFTVLRVDPSACHGVVTTLRLEPHTGRKHQLRRHMKALGCPIVGDTSYMPWISLKVLNDNGMDPPPLMLWAANITLPHPERPEEMVLADAGAEPPAFQNYRMAERPLGSIYSL